MRLHGHMSIQVVQSAIGLFTTMPATLVHALDLFITSSGPLVLLRTGNGNEGIHLPGQKNIGQSNGPRSVMASRCIQHSTEMQASSTRPRCVAIRPPKSGNDQHDFFRHHAPKPMTNVPGQGAALRSQQGRQNQPLWPGNYMDPAFHVEAEGNRATTLDAHTSAAGPPGIETYHGPAADRESREEGK
jgi:hypothetical protein